MTEIESENEISLANKKISSIKIDTLLPEISVTLSLEDFTDFSRSISLEVKKSTAELFREQVEKSVSQFEHDNKNLSETERYSPSYYYKLSVYYRLLGDAKNEGICLSKIKSNVDPFYEEQKAKNSFALSALRGAEENAGELLKISSAESTRSVSCLLLAKGEYKKANEEIRKFLEKTSDDDEEDYGLLCQYGLTFVLLNELESAAHIFRYVFYNVEKTSDAALMLAYIYRALFQSAKGVRQKDALFKRTGLWAKTALILNPSSKQGADFFFKTLFKAETDFFTRFMEKFVTFSSTKKDAAYYADSMNILGNCYFEKEKYDECLSVLQELCSGEHFSAGIWSNISLCNSKMGKADRALKNSAKAYAKLKSGDSSALRTNVSSIYMELLYKAKDFDGAIKVFSAEFGASFVPRTRKEYLQISDIYLNSLLEKREFGGYAGYLDFMWQCVKGAGGDDADEVKVCILNAKVRLFADIAPSGKILSECAAEYEKLFYAYRKKNKNLPLFFNNLVYSAIESGEKLENETLNLFISNAVQNCYLCATFGLYQARVKHNAEKCEYYYNKAATLILKDDFETRATLLDELKLKRDSELMRLAEQAGDTREAERLRSRILKKCPSELWFYARHAEEKQREENS